MDHGLQLVKYLLDFPHTQKMFFDFNVKIISVLYDFLNITGKLNDTNYMTHDLIKALMRISRKIPFLMKNCRQ